MTPPPFGTFPKIHSLWYQNPSLDRVNISQLKYNFFSFKIPFYICAVNVKMIDVVGQILNIVVQIIYFAKPMHANKHCRRTYDLGNQRSVRLSSVQPCSRQRWGQDPGKTVENSLYMLIFLFDLFYCIQILGKFFCFMYMWYICIALSVPRRAKVTMHISF